MRQGKPARLAVIALNARREKPISWEADWPAIVMFADGAGLDELGERGPHLDDWPEGLQRIPGSGVWVWEGEIVLTGGATSDGEEWDVHAEGAWRRPNAVEAWALMRGDAPWATAKAGIP